MKHILIAVLALAGAVRAGELVLAERGKPAAYTIVVGAKASPSEKYAAEELRDSLAKATGVAQPVLRGVPPADGSDFCYNYSVYDGC